LVTTKLNFQFLLKEKTAIYLTGKMQAGSAQGVKIENPEKGDGLKR